ncbi:hypothetical protein [Noviherbaspirillum sp. ST9]|uniref:hypothetical protein n=1 Tax=Noviherbaspirillum sp. ST9 TaxID=3401606 RepID=UPI003B589539
MVTSQSVKACTIALPLAVAIAACGGGGGDPGVSPQANNGADTRLHPETYVERWWPGCSEGAPCTPLAAR